MIFIEFILLFLPFPAFVAGLLVRSKTRKRMEEMIFVVSLFVGWFFSFQIYRLSEVDRLLGREIPMRWFFGDWLVPVMYYLLIALGYLGVRYVLRGRR